MTLGTTGTTLGLVAVATALFILGTVIGLIWHHRHAEDDEARVRQVQIGLSAFFILVGLIVLADLFVLRARFTDYVNETIPRDVAQEKCAADTLEVLHNWAEAHQVNELAEQRREAAHMEIVRLLIAGEPIPPEKVRSYYEAVVEGDEARMVLTKVYADNPVPRCFHQH